MAAASSIPATTLSIPKTAMCTGGSVSVRSALPSLVTITTVPVSAIAMLAPVMPTAALMNFWRRSARAWARMASLVGSVPSSAAHSSLVRWTAGARMCEGCSWRRCMMYSPRSVSTGCIPSDSRYGFSSISSVAIDFDLVTMPAPARVQMSPMIRRASAASCA